MMNGKEQRHTVERVELGRPIVQDALTPITLAADYQSRVEYLINGTMDN